MTDTRDGQEYEQAGNLLRLFQMPERSLSIRVWKDLLKPKYSSNLIALLKYGYLQSSNTLSDSAPSKRNTPLRRFGKTRDDVLRFPGRWFASYIQNYLGADTSRFCEHVNWCKFKAKVVGYWEELKQVDLEQKFLVSTIISSEAYILAQKSNELIALVKEATEMKIPLSLAALVMKYGLDELCKCCEDCTGSGLVADKPCVTCAGKGAWSAPSPKPSWKR